MSTKIALAAFAAATLVVVPALAEGEGEASATTTTTTTTATTGGEAKGGEEGPEFGNPGVINIGGTVPFGSASVGATSASFDVADAPTGFGFEQTSIKPPGGGDSVSATRFSLSPTIDYFVAEGISVGGFLGFGYTKAGEDPAKTTVTTYGIGPRVGYNLWLSKGSISFWPNLWFGYFGGSVKVGDADSASLSKMAIGVNLPFLIHPVKHFHFGIGPFFKMDVASKFTPPGGSSTDAEKATTFGIAGEIAGWL